VWRHYAPDHAPVATNFFAVGDAAIRTNPLYGRGCSIGVMHANILAEVLRATTDPLDRARQFAARTEAELRPIYDASLSEDQRGIRRAQAIAEGRAIDKAGGLKKWFGRAFGDALSAATREQIHVLRGLMRTFHLLEKPGEFLKDNRIRRTVLRYMLRGRKRNAAARLQPGPSRDEMYEVLQFEG
jgi:flavin-dependent dehydrogenase